MIWNLLIHIIAGIIGRNIFTIDLDGILWCLLIAIITQAVDMIRPYSYHKKRVDQAIPEVREKQMINFRRRAPIIMPQIYILKVLFYGIVTLAVAGIAR